MIKVLHFISNAAPCYFLYPIIEHHDHNRFEIIYASLSPAGAMHRDLEAQGYRTFSLDCKRRWLYPIAAIRLAWLIRKERVDIVHAHLFDACLVGMTAARLANRGMGIVTIQHSHEILLRFLKFGQRLSLIIDSIINKWLAHFVIAPSESIRDLLVDWEKVPERKVFIYPNCFELSRFRPSAASRGRIREEFGVGDDQIVIGTVGRLYWVKDHRMLIEAFSDLIVEHPHLRLVIAGDGPDEAALRAKVAGLSLSDKVIFAGNRADIPDILSAVDVYAHPSLAEAFCLAIAEAVASGCPVVTTDVGGASEVVENGVNGYIVPPGDGARFREALRELIRHRERWRSMSEAGIERMNSYSADKVSAEIEGFYEKVLGHAPDPSASDLPAAVPPGVGPA